MVVACGGAPATPGSAPSSAAPGASASVPLPDPTAPVVVGETDPGARSFDATADVGLGLAKAEVAARAAFRADAGMTTLLGADAQVVADALDAQTDATLRELLAGAGVAGAGGSELGGQLASVEEAPPVVQGPAQAGPPPPGLSLLGPWSSAVAMVRSAVEAIAPYERSTAATDEITVGASSGSVRTTATVKVTPSGSKVIIEIEAKTSGEVIGADGTLLFKIEGVGKARIEAECCPDAAGLAAATVTFSASENYFGGNAAGSAGQSFDNASEADIRVYSNEAAEVDRTEVDSRGEQTTRNGTRTAGGATDSDGYSLGIAEAYTMAGTSGPITSRGAQVTDVDGATRANGQTSFDLLFYLTSNAAWATATAVETAWRSGKCLDLIVDPEGGDVDPDSVTDVVAKVKHHFEGNELDKPVTATLAGVKTVDPAGEKQPAPATVKYTAGSEEGETGDIAFESVSNRGIAKKTVRFTVGSTAWTVGFKGTTSQVANAALGPEKISLKATISDLRVTAKDGQVTGRGKLHLKGTHKAGCFSGKLDQVVPIDLDGSLVGTGPEAVLRVTFSRPSPSTGTIVLSCPQVASWPFPDAAYSEFFWFVIGTVDLPAAGGTVDFDRTVELLPRSGTATGTFTVTKVP